MRINRKYSNKKRHKQYKYSKRIRGGENSPTEDDKRLRKTRTVTAVFTNADPFPRTTQPIPIPNTIKAKFSKKDPFENTKTNVYEDVKKATERAKEEDDSWIQAMNKDSMQSFTFGQEGGRKKFTKKRKNRKSLIRKHSYRRH